ncbi:hypothetical protein AGABI1DRAFT_132976 [Agaricus bisporus var. burnettii JB137-S8]|uniref:Core-binding (CB) domain-containing protein n=1 Tax=Agaricus bisporus var. burnettii (strain JB137-S8 / ATCC MYA-4627 / FGSC 10392) TaxID=597362 RepID=K5VK62_AGABU|nr:uncharacterized protein AGABI1DRAFT_132976 [Agaricus bisporus var. burnettii JB137-S8]EKM74719.1 hypothetical protein AGABI1DRAFT_132976 [Agaricus bisporus var. burnettii JB137-S8]
MFIPSRPVSQPPLSKVNHTLKKRTASVPSLGSVPSTLVVRSRSSSYDKRFDAVSRDGNSPASSLTHSKVSDLPPASSFHPKVKARERLSRWSSPFAEAIKEELSSTIPAELLDCANSAVLDGLAPNTQLSYAAGILRFTQFCDTWDIPETDRMPASSTLLAAFASSYVGHYGGKTINQWLSGI